MLASDLILETHPINPHDLFSPIHLQLYLSTKSKAIPTSVYAATAPIGTGRPISKIMIAHASGETVGKARKALVKEILGGGGEALRYITMYYSIVAGLYGLSSWALMSVRRGIEGMKRVSEREWRGRLEQVRRAGVDAEWGFDARLEVFLLEGGCWELGRWGECVDAALRVGDGERKSCAAMYDEVGGFLEVVGGSLAK